MENQKRTKGSRFWKTAATAAVLIGTVSLGFNALTQSLLAAEYEKVSSFPAQQQPFDEAAPELPAGYTAHAYILAYDESNSDRPSRDEIIAVEAAEIGSQWLYRVYGLQLQDTDVITMSYFAGRDVQRAEWMGSVRLSEDLEYGFSMDALTGAIHSASRWETLDALQFDGPDWSLINDLQGYEEKARGIAADLGLFREEIAVVEYYGQGHFNYHHHVDLLLTSNSGEEMVLSFSREDGSLVSFSSDAMVKQSRRVEEFLIQQIETMAEGMQLEGDDSEPILFEIVEHEAGDFIWQQR